MVTNQTASLVATNSLRDIKPPVEIPSGWEWLWWVLGVLAVGGVCAAILVYLLRRRSRMPAAPPIPAHVRARQKLQEALALIAQPKPFCIFVSDTVRQYLEERFDFHAPERTTEEFLYELRGTNLLAPDQKDGLGEFLQRCDLVKFAKYEPGEPELRDLHNSALRLVEETEPVEIKAESEKRESGNEAPEEIVNRKFTEKPATTMHSGNFSKAQVFAIVGTFLQLAPTIWVVGYFVSIYRLFRLGMDAPATVSSHGINALPEIMSQELTIMKSEMWLILISVLIGLAGLVLLLISLVPLRYRAEWFFWFLTIYGLMLCGAFPFGTVFGVFFLVYCLTKRHEFLQHS